MGIGNLFKGYVFFKLLGLGIGFIAIGIIGFAFTVLDGDPSILLIAIPFLLIGLGALYVCLRIYRSDKDYSSTGSTASTSHTGQLGEHSVGGAFQQNFHSTAAGPAHRESRTTTYGASAC